MKKENTVIVALAVLAAVIAATWLILVAPGLTGNEINMTRGVTQQSGDHVDLHMIVLWICVVIGIGVNIRRPTDGWPKEINQRVTDLSTASGRAMNRLDVALAIIHAMELSYSEFQSHGFDAIREAWWRAHAASGHKVRAHGSEGYVEGIAEALDNDGALLLRVDGVLRRFIAGDIELMDPH